MPNLCIRITDIARNSLSLEFTTEAPDFIGNLTPAELSFAPSANDAPAQPHPTSAPRFEPRSHRRRPAYSSQRVTDHVVIDHTTGLMWSRDNVTEGRVNHAAAEQACNDLDLAGHSDWRLPTRAELLSLVDDTRRGPAIDTDAFPDTRSDWYWTGTPYAAGSSGAWFVSFSLGYSYYCPRVSDSGFVRAVRSLPAGQ